MLSIVHPCILMLLSICFEERAVGGNVLAVAFVARLGLLHTFIFQQEGT